MAIDEDVPAPVPAKVIEDPVKKILQAKEAVKKVISQLSFRSTSFNSIGPLKMIDKRPEVSFLEFYHVPGITIDRRFFSIQKLASSAKRRKVESASVTLPSGSEIVFLNPLVSDLFYKATLRL